MPWAVARSWCLTMGLKMPLLKKVIDLDEVANELKKLGNGKCGFSEESEAGKL
jgi:hypothetical protein